MAPAIPVLESRTSAPGFVRELMIYFKEHDPTATLRLLSLLYHEPIETLIEVLDVDSGMRAFQMISYGFTLNSIADLLEAARVLGFTKEAKHG